MYGKMVCAKFSGNYSPRSRSPFCTRVFILNADGSLVLGNVTPVHNGQGSRGEKNQKLEFRGPFLPVFGRLGLPSKIQTAITSSILGVRGSSSDGRELSATPFNYTTLVT